MSESSGHHYLHALQRFRAARNRAELERLWARLRGKSADLLSFEDVRRQIKAKVAGRRTRKEIPLAAIVGSVGRYQDFTRTFLPRTDATSERWSRVRAAVETMSGLPPIECYQIGDAYFVEDGNHRVSVAGEMGATHIEGYVIQIETNVQLSPDDDWVDIILKAAYADFLDYTQIDALRPDHNVHVTSPVGYTTLMEMVDLHHYFLSREQGAKVTYSEAVTDWYDNAYVPAVALIDELGILRNFPDRTPADLYAWIARHRTDISERVGWTVNTHAAAVDLMEEMEAENPTARLREAVTPDTLESGPPPGSWRRTWLPTRRDDRLFRDMLVAINGQPQGWRALDQALVMARADGGALHGLHVVREEGKRFSGDVGVMRAEFLKRCRGAGVSGDFRSEVGGSGSTPVVDALVDRARWADAVVMPLTFAPGNQALDRLSSGMSLLLRRCPRPVLTVPGDPSPMRHALLAYDGSPKAREALYIGAYMAARWETRLTVIGVAEEGLDLTAALAEAAHYTAEMNIAPETVTARGPAAHAILDTAADRGCDLLLLGGYGANAMLTVIVGSTVDEILRTTKLPVLICR